MKFVGLVKSALKTEPKPEIAGPDLLPDTGL